MMPISFYNKFTRITYCLEKQLCTEYVHMHTCMCHFSVMGGSGDLLGRVREVLRSLPGSHQVTKKMILYGFFIRKTERK